MEIVVLANESLKEELLGTGLQPGTEVKWISDLEKVSKYKDAVAFIDLLFENNAARLHALEQLLPALVIINSVEHTLTEIHPSFVRINGWNTFLKSALIEASASDAQKQKTEKVFALFHKKLEWLPDEPGFVTPRVISSIINEAYISLEEGVSSKEQINTAMKLGTNYPYGPFEWAQKIGVHKLASLLNKLAKSQSRYQPSPLLTSV